MQLRHLGYACINRALGCTTGGTTRLSHLTPDKAREVTRDNLANLMDILWWNVREGIRFFRVSSELIPFASHADYPIDWQAEFADDLAEIRDYVGEHDLRLSVHPGQYTVLNSLNEDVVQRAVADLEYHAAMIHALDPWQGTMTLHVGGAYGDKPMALQRFIDHFDRLSQLAQRTLILENDDKTFNVDDVLSLCRRLDVPLVFDIFHHQCNPPHDDWRTGLTETLEAVVETWHGRVPKCHISSQGASTPTSHADYITPEDMGAFVGIMAEVQPYDGAFDLMLEAKEKDHAVKQALSDLAAA